MLSPSKNIYLSTSLKFYSFNQSKLSGCHDFAAGTWYVTAACTVFSTLQISSTVDISGFFIFVDLICNSKCCCQFLIFSLRCSINEFMWLDFAINMGLGYCMTGISKQHCSLDCNFVYNRMAAAAPAPSLANDTPPSSIFTLCAPLLQLDTFWSE